MSLCQIVRRPKEDIKATGTGGGELSSVGEGTQAGPLEEHKVLFITDPSLKP